MAVCGERSVCPWQPEVAIDAAAQREREKEAVSKRQRSRDPGIGQEIETKLRPSWRWGGWQEVRRLAEASWERPLAKAALRRFARNFVLNVPALRA